MRHGQMWIATPRLNVQVGNTNLPVSAFANGLNWSRGF
jgi:hypothetical protein